jgi:hypothetical protein
LSNLKCKAVSKSTGQPCKNNGKPNLDGYCNTHKNLAFAKQSSVPLAPSTPAPDDRPINNTSGTGFGVSGKVKKTEKKAVGRRGAMAEVLKLCKTEDSGEPNR